MSWNAVIIRVPSELSAEDLTGDQAKPLGTTAEIGEKLQALFPEADHRLGMCSIDGNDFWIEANFGYPKDVDVRDYIGIRTSGGVGAIPILRQICELFDARLYDAQIGNFADFEDRTESSMDAFSQFRDRQLRHSEEDQN